MIKCGIGATDEVDSARVLIGRDGRSMSAFSPTAAGTGFGADTSVPSNLLGLGLAEVVVLSLELLSGDRGCSV